MNRVRRALLALACAAGVLAALAGGAAGPWATGWLFDLTGSYTIAFAIGVAVSILSAVAIWRASPRKVRAVAGQMHKAHIGSSMG
jgi:cyanate permease